MAAPQLVGEWGLVAIAGVLFVGAVVRVAVRWGRDLQARDEAAGASGAGQRAPPALGFPVIPLAGGEGGASRYRVSGVSRRTGEWVELRFLARGHDDARVTAELHGVASNEIRKEA